MENIKTRGHPELNQGPLDLQSNALPLSYIPDNNLFIKLRFKLFKKLIGPKVTFVWKVLYEGDLENDSSEINWSRVQTVDSSIMKLQFVEKRSSHKFIGLIVKFG